jgi:uncharacterized membrane protein
MNYRSSSPLDQLVGACAGLLVAASMLYLAAKLIEAVWVVLLVIVPPVVCGVGWFWWRRRQQEHW